MKSMLDWPQDVVSPTPEMESSSSSGLFSFFDSFDTDPFLRNQDGLLSFCNDTRSEQGMDSVLMYVNDAFNPEMGAQSQINPCDSSLIEDKGGAAFQEDPCGHFFELIPSMEELDKGPAPCISNITSSNFEKNTVESWINGVLDVASQPEESFVNSPHLSEPSTPFDASMMVNFWFDGSLQSMDDVLEKVGTESVADLEECLAGIEKYIGEGGEGVAWVVSEGRNEGGSALVPEAAVEVVEKVADVAEQVAAQGLTVGMQAPPVAEQGLRVVEKGAGVAKRGRIRRGSGRARRPMVAIRRREPNVVDLRGLLVNCAEAVAAANARLANNLLSEIWQHASPLGNGIQRLAHYFAEGLAARLSGTGTTTKPPPTTMGNYSTAAAAMPIQRAYHTFVAVCPFLKLSHFSANEAILALANGVNRLHIVDFNILYGFQWPCFLHALAQRAGGPPTLRITGIDIPLPATTAAPPVEHLHYTGRLLASHAKRYGIPFEYHSLVCRWEDVSPSSLHLRPDETLVVNCMYRLRHLLDDTMGLSPPASCPRKAVLALLRRLNPKLFVEGVVNAAYNVPFFLSRFREALFHYSSVFDALDTTVRGDLEERLVIERDIMGREILNVVACEGLDRRERPETYRQWQLRTRNAGFEIIPLDPSVRSKAQAVARGFYHKDYHVENDDLGYWLLLGWKGRILHGISTWRPSSSSVNTPLLC